MSGETTTTTTGRKPKKAKNPRRVDAQLHARMRSFRRVMLQFCWTAAGGAALWVAAVVLGWPPIAKWAGGAVAVACAVMALDAWSRYVEARGKRVAFCRACGFDLRATERVCPECGAAVPEELLAAREAGKARPASEPDDKG